MGKRQNAKTAVIFVSDGDPTFRYRSDGYTEGNGSSDEDGKSLKAGKDAVADMQTDYFFTVGVGPSGNYKKLTDLANSAVKAGKHASYAGTTLANLNKAFDDIQKQITELACTNVTISDPLSENVEMMKGADGNVLAPQVQIFDTSGNPVNAAGLGITASYDSASKSVKMHSPQTINCGRLYL